MDIRMLGHMRVTVDGRPVRLPASQRAIVAMLALQPNRPISADRLIDGLWGDDAPVSATKTLQSHVSLLRRQLGSIGEPDSSPITTEPNGYSLRIDALAIDTQRFENGLDRGRQMSGTEPLAARDVLRDALAMWQGPALADFTYEPFAEPEIRRLEELRLQAVEQLAEVQLALGENDAVVGELRHALVEAAYREQLWASLMTALARSGRTAEALLAYRELETRLRTDLDAEPGPDLQALAIRIRSADPSLLQADAPSAMRSSTPGLVESPSAGTRSGARVLPIVLAVVGVAVALAGLAVLLTVRQPAPAGADSGQTSVSGQAGPSSSDQASPPLLNHAELALLAQLPGAVGEDCVAASIADGGLGDVASLRCVLPLSADAEEVRFDRFSTSDSMEAAFNDLVQGSSARAGDCGTTQRAVDSWEVPQVHSGRLLCYPAVGEVRIAWTYEADRLLARAIRQGSESGALYDWWRRTAMFLR
jgi:DNA-binding SARP family transcriptional activator